ncbi:MAG: LPP20 family lipoprotein [Oceanospirillaceae bacterium]|nr:LPP20 family lipoprotein [Oceanospirillaceae bacterium]
MEKLAARTALVLSAVLVLAGCGSLGAGSGSVPPQASGPDIVSVTGYAPISLQPGQTQQHRMLMAMRASKLRAYQELAAVVHGQYLYGTTQVSDMVLQNDRFRAAVAGIVRGARVVKTFPVQDDTYATTLELDLNQVQRAWVVSDGTEYEGCARKRSPCQAP